LGGGFTTSQIATNSMVKVDGFPAEADEYLQRSSNTVADVIEGVSVNLFDSGTSQVTVTHDVTSIMGKIEAFINAVNYAQDFIRLQTKFDDTGENTGLLIGNYGFYTLKTRIDSILYSPVSGLDSDVDTYTLLAQIGIESDPDNEGSWTIDSSKLRSALNTDPDAVANLFVNNSSRSTKGVARQMYEEMLVQTNDETGMGPILVSNYNDIIKNINSKIEHEENRIALFEERQTLRFARLEATLAELNAQQNAIESQIDQMQKK
jgi:flagellar hook-associated protein 2